MAEGVVVISFLGSWGEIDIAFDPISKINPTVRIKKNRTATAKPNVLIFERVTPKGNNNTNSKSNIKNSIATTTKWIWNDSLVWVCNTGIPPIFKLMTRSK